MTGFSKNTFSGARYSTYMAFRSVRQAFSRFQRRASSSATINPILCRVLSYSFPIFPSPAIIFICQFLKYIPSYKSAGFYHEHFLSALLFIFPRILPKIPNDTLFPANCQSAGPLHLPWPAGKLCIRGCHRRVKERWPRLPPYP